MVSVHPDDFVRLLPHRAQLETQWRDLLAHLASALGREATAVSVVLRPDAAIVAGSVSIEAVLDPTPAQPAAYALEIESGVARGRRFPLRGEVTIGRSNDNVVALNDPQVSRRHARIVLEDGRVTIEDVGSLNGTYVNGERAGRAHLTANDAIVIGDTKLRIIPDA